METIPEMWLCTLRDLVVWGSVWVTQVVIELLIVLQYPIVNLLQLTVVVECNKQCHSRLHYPANFRIGLLRSRVDCPVLYALGVLGRLLLSVDVIGTFEGVQDYPAEITLLCAVPDGLQVGVIGKIPFGIMQIFTRDIVELRRI